MSTKIGGMVVWAFCVVAGCDAGKPAEPEASLDVFTPVGAAGLNNAHRVTEKVIAGAQPEGEAWFAALRELGVKTIISVDGAAPDVETAQKYGLRYVHLPIEYSGVSDEQGRMIGKAIVELPGPIYVHCHHGKHRSAAAVAVACVYNGTLEPSRAEEVLRMFGTGANYKGLWQAARDARPLDPKVLNQTQVKYVASAKIGAMAEAMVKLDRRWDGVKVVQKAGWEVPADHPDLDPGHVSLQLQEMLVEMGRSSEAAGRPVEFRRLLEQSAAAAGEMREALKVRPVNGAMASAAAKRIGAMCVECHRAYRD